MIQKMFKNAKFPNIALLSLFVSCFVFFSVPLNAAKVELLGAGATFPYPAYSKMFKAYHDEFKTKVNYQSIGSGGGIRQLKNATVDFGASDAFIKKKDLIKWTSDVLHIPTAIGGIVLSYNIPGVKDAIKLDGKAISEIYLGTIHYWNHAYIKKLNPKIKLPKIRIVVIYRSDGSGTTAIFTDYLSKISKTWKNKLGSGKVMNWPIGIGGKGNAGVAKLIKQIPGSFGYVTLSYAIQNKLPKAMVKNSKGQYISASVKSVMKASSSSTIPSHLRVSITDPNLPDAYPIAGFTWILLLKDVLPDRMSREKLSEVKKLVKWMITDGQKFLPPLSYAPISPEVREKAMKLLDTLTYDSAPFN